MKGDELSERFLEFAARIIVLVQSLPNDRAGRHISGQLLRCGTSIGANYEEARGAESQADFIHKIGVAWKESRESKYWLRLIQKSKLLASERLNALIQEASEISAILAKSHLTARSRQKENTLPSSD